MLLAFHGKEAIKTKYVNRIAKHVKADELIQGYGYWKDGKGCAVGCTLHSSDHGAYETELGIPRHLARLEDVIFERLPIEDARVWPGKFLNAPKVGANLSLVWPKFAIWLLTDKDAGVLRLDKKAKVQKAIQDVSKLWQRVIDGESVESLSEEFKKEAEAWRRRRRPPTPPPPPPPTAPPPPPPTPPPPPPPPENFTGKDAPKNCCS